MFNKHDLSRDEFMLKGRFARKGYDWWWHSFTAINEKTKEEKPFYIEFFICNPGRGEDYPIYGQLKENQEKGILPAYLMVNVGFWKENHAQLHRFFGIKEIEIHKKKPYSVKADDCYMDEEKTYGKISITKEESLSHPEYMSDSGEISWNINIHKLIAFNVGYGAGKLFRTLQAFEMFWHAEGMKSEYNGEITLNGERYLVEDKSSYGYADKNWGRDFTSPWVWLSSCNLESKITGKILENSVFDIGGGRPKVYFIPFNRKLLGALYLEGKEYEFNFSKFWHPTKTKFSYEETNDLIVWHVSQKCRGYLMETNIKCYKKDMIFVNYESPDGMKRYSRLWNGGNGFGTIKLSKKKILLADLSVKNVGCEYGEYDK